jgi:hypothetical protein
MILAAILGATLVILGNIALLLVAVRYIEEQKRVAIGCMLAYKQTFIDFFAPDGDKPSEFALVVDSVSTIAAQRITNTLKASLMGMAGVDARNEKRLEGDLIHDLANNASPLLGIAMDMFPQVGKRLIKNPELIGFAGNMFGKMTGKKPGNNGHVETPPSGDFGQRMNAYKG